ncbi:hypothetical protein SeMB42_g04388 [Synchytrium endobioticum]|uniref:Ribosome maturation protein SDO1/SBDS N-terminal domain-containing protein n=1 Tax=Synchytrium endobioticum TaxID=286115 RepID=A0A507CZG6_9FUNG|nr:hypothetical protein SeLEV6574_g07857 [Synchytrium endobioticum]TPX44300.1 hypothetical protein SeMB42_g04388 [Synchytrium endobioticum]
MTNDKNAGKRTTTRVTYQDKHEGPHDFVLYAENGMVNKWRTDRTIPLVDVLQSFDIFITERGAQGVLSRASKADLHAQFGTEIAEDVIKTILEKGELSETNVVGRREERHNRNDGRTPTGLPSGVHG